MEPYVLVTPIVLNFGMEIQINKCFKITHSKMFYKSKFGSFQIFGAIGFKWTLVRSSYPFVLNFGMAMETDEKT